MPAMYLTLAESGAESAHAMLPTVVGALAGGTFLLVVARRAGIPALVLLLLGGIVLGPEVLGIVDPDSMGGGLLLIVELAVGLILFEGGLTLRLDGYRAAPAMIKRLLSLGVVITWLATTCMVRFILELPWSLSLIAASLVIVTGPTVIGPLLKRIRVSRNLHDILHWEAVLIDPIGVFIAVLCFEWLGAPHAGPTALLGLGTRVGAGLLIGAAGGLVLVLLIRKRWIPTDMINIFALAFAVLIFGLGELVKEKSGLLSVTVAGFGFSLAAPPGVTEIRRFKAELTDLLIATLFVLLSARLEFDQFQHFGLRGVLTVLAIMVIVRPLSIFVCSAGLDLTVRDKLFLSWVAPRGIVAASMASLFAIALAERGAENPRLIETFTYSVILATIIIQAPLAGALAGVLGVRRPDPTGWLIVGANAFALRIGSFIQTVCGRHVVFVDVNVDAVRQAGERGMQAIRDDARDPELIDRHQLLDIGHLLALTDNEDLNERICATWAGALGADHVHRCHAGRVSLPPDEGAEHNVLWPSLPQPGVLSAEMRDGTTVLLERKGGVTPRNAALLMTCDGRRLKLDPEPDDADGEDTTALYIRRVTNHLVRSMRPELIVLDAEPSSLEALVGDLTSRLAEVAPQLEHDATATEIMARESSFPSVIGSGIAVPHAYSDEVTEQLCALARIPGGVKFPLNEDPVHLVFMVISPRNAPGDHLALLAQIARVVSRDDTRQALMDAETPDEIMRLVRK